MPESKPRLTLYNTLTRKKEPFEPFDPPHVGMYVCGLTVYDFAHIGHARTAVAFETIRRWLKYRGYEVTFVQNVTDIDDRIIDRANELKVDPQVHAARWTQICNTDMTHLGVSMPDVQPKVTEHLPQIIELIQALEKNGFAYKAKDGSVYYRVGKKTDYGKLSNRSPEELLAGARVEPAEGKENPNDFALWKAWKPGEPKWPSPWGDGRPGWHIECSAMSKTYLGEQFDLHGGGLDLVFPHHENEVAQSEGATGKTPFSRYWLHTGFLTVNGEKMSKSLKNFITIQDMLKTREPEAVRFFYANTHYRSGIDYSSAAFDDAARGLERLRRMVADLERLASGETVGKKDADQRLLKATSTLERDFGRGMDDDFNTREAVGALFQFVTDANKAIAEGAGSAPAQLGRAIFLRLARVLTLFPETVGAKDEKDVEALMDVFTRLREELRRKKDFQLSDLVRDELGKIGFEVADAKVGAKWRRKS